MNAFAWPVVIHTWFVVMAILIGINVLTMDRYAGWLIWVGVGWFVLGAFLVGYRGEHL
jgi:hypothetical protein